MLIRVMVHFACQFYYIQAVQYPVETRRPVQEDVKNRVLYHCENRILEH